MISSTDFNGAGLTVLAMITTKAHPPWPGDCRIENYRDAGLNVRCIIRLKLFTLDNRLLIRRLGRQSKPDATQIDEPLRYNLLLSV